MIETPSISSECGIGLPPKKWWIRRHRVLALLTPFVTAIVFAILFFTIHAQSIQDMLEAAKFGFSYSLLSTIVFAYVLKNMNLSAFWFFSTLAAAPFYLIPAVVFTFSKFAKKQIVAYVIYCALTVSSILAGWAIIVELVAQC